MQHMLTTYSFPAGKTPVVAKTYTAAVIDLEANSLTPTAVTILYGWDPRYKKTGRVIAQRSQNYISTYTHHKLIAQYSAGELI